MELTLAFAARIGLLGPLSDMWNACGGRIGCHLAHENEAPFPEKLAESFVRSFCPPSGVVLDPFCGSGTTLAVALRHGRRSIRIDIRESQVDLTKRRVEVEHGCAVRASWSAI